MRSAGISAALALCMSLGACGGGSGSTDTGKAAQHQKPRPTLTLTATTHRPVAGAPWPITIRAYGPAGSPLQAEVRYQYLFGGAVVARRSRYRFRGTFHDTFRWPADASATRSLSGRW
ncbi:MAG: hypothetical protein U0R26_09245 [Solirubrobacterales bacterium]